MDLRWEIAAGAELGHLREGRGRLAKVMGEGKVRETRSWKAIREGYREGVRRSWKVIEGHGRR